ncbi:MAG: glycosyltransferase, partial [Limisphaerales bacterium]
KEILYLGRLHRIKGIDHLLKGWAQVESKFEDWSLAIAGPEESYGRGVAYADEMKKLASDLSLQRVEFRGPKYGDEKLQAYREASVFVLPSHSENFGMTVAEALACATPAIVTKGAPWDGLEANDAGWWIDVGVDPLVRALGDAMSRPMNRLEEMGQAGRDYVRREFDWTNIGEKTTAAYRWLLGQADRPDCVVVD